MMLRSGRAGLAAALFLGLLILAAVLSRFDLGLVVQALARIGFLGFVLLLLAGLGVEAVLAAGLYPLLPRRRPVLAIFAARQLRDSAADLLPITQLGGVAVAARALVLAGIAAPRALAIVITDVTTELFAQGAFILIGLAVGLHALRASTHLSAFINAILAGALFLSLGSIGFALFQLLGSRWAEQMLERQLSSRIRHAASFRRAIHRLYHRRGRIALSALLHLLGWLASGVWLWLMLRLIGYRASLQAGLAIQALVEGLRSITVFIPAAIGIQEAGYAALAPAFGFSPETGLALSLLRRARDLCVGMPVLLMWQALEAARLKRKRKTRRA